MEKNRFVEIMESVKRKSAIRDSVAKSLQGANVLYEISHDDEIVDLLADIFNDEDEWISFWVWELDFGEHADRQSASIDGRNVALFTAEQLYDLLTGTPVYIDDITVSDYEEDQTISFVELANRITESMYATSYDRIPRTVK